MSKQNEYGLLAEFDNPHALLKAAQKMNQEGFKEYDCHSPFPIHGMDDAMGLKRSPQFELALRSHRYYQWQVQNQVLEYYHHR